MYRVNRPVYHNEQARAGAPPIVPHSVDDKYQALVIDVMKFFMVADGVPDDFILTNYSYHPPSSSLAANNCGWLF